MKKTLLIIAICSFLFAANKPTKPYNLSSPVKLSELQKDLDSIYEPVKKLVDTTNHITLTIEGIRNGDTLIDTIKITKAAIGTISGKVKIDTISGKVKIDTIYRRVEMDTIVGVDTLYAGRAKILYGAIAWLRATGIQGRTNMDTVEGIDTLYSASIRANKIYVDTVRDSMILTGPILMRGGKDIRLFRSDNVSMWSLFNTNNFFGALRYKADGTVQSWSFEFDSSGNCGIGGLPDASYKLWVNGNFLTSNGKVFTDGVRFGSADTSTLKYYTDTTFKDTMLDGTTFRAYTASARIIRVGQAVTLYQPILSGTITSTTTTYIKGIPAKFIPSASSYSPIANGCLYFSSGNVSITKADGSYLDAGTNGINSTYAQWIIQ
jgi:hypothetical protein